MCDQRHQLLSPYRNGRCSPLAHLAPRFRTSKRTDPDLPTRTEGEGETLEMQEGFESFTPGQVLGERYQILEMLGRGGMGEVWHAFDLKLRVEVALKALREDLFKSERRLEMLRDEVRASREVMSANICRIFGLIEVGPFPDRETVPSW